MTAIGLKGLANYMSASMVRRRAVLREYKYYSHAGPAQAIYYGPAREVLVAYHRLNPGPAWLFDRAAEMDALAEQSQGQMRAQARNNARALRQYARHFGTRRYEVLADLDLTLRFADVTVTVRPDLHVRERGREKLIRLEFSKDPPAELTTRLVPRGLYQAARQAGLPITPAGALYIDVPRAQVHTGGPLGTRLEREVTAACQTIRAIWDEV